MEGNRGTQLYSNPAYWGVMVLTIFFTFLVSFLISEVGERDEFDDLNKKIDENNERLTNRFSALIASIDNLANEIRKGRAGQ
jgi:hypothetical protein